MQTWSQCFTVWNNARESAFKHIFLVETRRRSAANFILVQAKNGLADVVDKPSVQHRQTSLTCVRRDAAWEHGGGGIELWN